MFKAIALSLALFVGLGTIIPFTTNYTEASHTAKKRKKKRNWKGVKKYSKRWWQLYRRQERRKKARAKAGRSLRLRQIRLANAGRNNDTPAYSKTTERAVARNNQKSAVLPSGEVAPKSWQGGQTANNEQQYQVTDDNGSQTGSASISIVGPASSQNADSKTKNVGGVATSSLRRTVIDKMVKEEGWVVNDYQKQIGGKSVYVVVAQSPGVNNRVQSRLFYFTEVDGNIYSVATNAPVENAQKLEQESEKVVNSLQRRNIKQQANLR